MTSAINRDDTLVVIGWLPIDRLETLVELGRSGKLPLAENGPEEKNSTDGGSDDNQNGQGSVPGFVAVAIVRGTRLSLFRFGVSLASIRGCLCYGNFCTVSLNHYHLFRGGLGDLEAF
jgi:hypothetical protein